MHKRQFCTPHLIEAGSVKRLERVALNERGFSEKWLQQLLFDRPALLPVDDIEPLFSPLCPLAMELPTSVGPVDLICINPDGYITLVETKLWRNPTARRDVVAQIVDYATAMSRWTYDDLCEAVRRARNLRSAANEDLVAATVREYVEDADEWDSAAFIDTVSRGLSRGRFLLLIAGDGIHENAEALASTLSKSPHLGFSLALVELGVYRMPGDDRDRMLVQPRVLARTKELVRAVVEIRTPVDQAEIAVTLPQEQSATRRAAGGVRRTLTHEVFLEHVAEATSPATADRLREFLDRAEEIGVEPTPKAASVSLAWVPPDTEDRFTFGSIRKDGSIDLSFVHYAFRRSGIDESIGKEYVESVASLIPGAMVQTNATRVKVSWRVFVGTRELTIEDLLPNGAGWLSVMQRMMQRIARTVDAE